MIVLLLHGLSLLLYVVASITLVRSFATGSPDAPRSALPFTSSAVALHALAIVAYATTHRELPLVGLAPSLSTLAFLIAMVLLATTRVKDARGVALVVVPFIVLLLGVAMLVGVAPAGTVLRFSGVWFAAHVVFALLGYAGFALSFAAGLLFLLQHRELKTRRFGRIFRFAPPLATLDRLGRNGALAGFATLTIGLLIGWAWTVRFHPQFDPANPQVIWGVLTWLALAGVLGARAGGPKAARRSALVSVIAFGFVVALFCVLRLTMVAGRSFL